VKGRAKTIVFRNLSFRRIDQPAQDLLLDRFIYALGSAMSGREHVRLARWRLKYVLVEAFHDACVQGLSLRRGGDRRDYSLDHIGAPYQGYRGLFRREPNAALVERRTRRVTILDAQIRRAIRRSPQDRGVHGFTGGRWTRYDPMRNQRLGARCQARVEEDGFVVAGPSMARNWAEAQKPGVAVADGNEWLNLVGSVALWRSPCLHSSSSAKRIDPVMP